MHRNATNNTIHETCVGKASRETMHSSGVELKIWLKQGKEKRLPARKKRTRQGFYQKHVDGFGDKMRQDYA